MEIKVLFRNHQMLGDTLMMTCGVRDLKLSYPQYLIKVDTAFMDIWKNNPYITDFDKPDLEFNVGAKILTQQCNTTGLHFCNAFRICFEDRLNLKIQQGICHADIHLTDAEKKRKIINGKYWIINTDFGCFPLKAWKYERWQEVVDRAFDITFVQTGSKQHNKFRLKGKNVIDMVGKTDNLRDLFVLYYNCEGSIGLISSQMHLAGAFEKPCVVVAGAREPSGFERYPWHRFISNQGAMKCSKVKSCFKCVKCDYKVNDLPKCMDLITADDVLREIELHYKGEALTKDTNIASVITDKKKKLKVVANVHTFGGAERSTVEILKMANELGWETEIIPIKHLGEEVRSRVSFAKLSDDITGECDVILLYCSDSVFEFNKDEYKIFDKCKAKKKVMVITYKIGKIGQEEWTKNFNLYMFLSSDMRDNFNTRIPNKETFVVAPPVEIDKFLLSKIDYDKKLHIVRHSSQGDAKYSQDIVDIVKSLPDTEFSFMPAPTFMPDLPNVHKYNKNELPVEEFLKKGNCFWYLLPEKYTDQGPRVIVEAMASGLAVIAENRDGAKDRVTDCGWLINSHNEAIDVIKRITSDKLRKKGNKARVRAKTAFKKELWIDKIMEGI